MDDDVVFHVVGTFFLGIERIANVDNDYNQDTAHLLSNGVSLDEGFVHDGAPNRTVLTITSKDNFSQSTYGLVQKQVVVNYDGVWDTECVHVECIDASS